MDNLSPKERCIRFLMGDATAQEVEALNAWIAESPANAQQFALLAAQETQMSTAVGNICAPASLDDKPDWVDQALAERRKHELEDEANRQLAAQLAEDERNRRFELRRSAEPGQAKRVVVIPKLAVAGLIAAILLVVAGVVYEAGKPEVTTPPEAVVESPVQPRVETPTIHPVATLQAAHQPEWGEGGAWPHIGGGLLPGQYELVSGAVEVEFNSGATVLIEAPARFELVDDNSGRLELGALTASVPQPAQGFTVYTPEVELVDLGTEFGVRVSQTGDIQSHVFDGEVLASASGPQSSHGPILLREEEGLFVTDGVVTLSPQPGGFIRHLDDEDYRVQLTGDVEQVFAPPASLAIERYQRDDMARLIVESRGVQLGERDRVYATLSRPGSIQSPFGNQEIGLGPVRVDSYLLHFDVASDLIPGVEEQTVTGEITFPRPVLAVQCSQEGLVAGDRHFGAPGTVYESTAPARGLYSTEEHGWGDQVWLSDDRLTLRFEIKANNMDQCRILIEAARPRESDE